MIILCRSAEMKPKEQGGWPVPKDRLQPPDWILLCASQGNLKACSPCLSKRGLTSHSSPYGPTKGDRPLLGEIDPRRRSIPVAQAAATPLGDEPKR
jgi:hypothetical protein